MFPKTFYVFPTTPAPPPKKKMFKAFQKYPASNPPFPGTSVHFQRLKTNPSTPRGPMATWGAAEAVLKQASLGRSEGIPFPKKTPQRFGFFLLGRMFFSLVGRCFFWGWKPWKILDYWRLWLERVFFVSMSSEEVDFQVPCMLSVSQSSYGWHLYSKMRCRSCSCWAPRMFQSIQSTSVFIRRMKGAAPCQ